MTRVKVGDHVVCSFIPACGICRYCSTGHQNLCDWGAQMMTGMLADGTFRFHDDDGADLGGFCMLGTFAERAVVSQNSCVPIEADIPFEVAALTGCGVPTGWGTAVYAAGVRAGQTVVIFGAGGVGSNAVQGARYAGAANVIVIDPVAFKRESALTFGATHVFADAADAQEAVIDLTRGQLADHALITIGVLNAEVVDQAAAIVGKGCQVTITSVGRSAEKQIQLAANGSVVGWQRRIQGHVFGMCNPLNDIPRLLRLYRAGQLKLDELITRRYSLDDINAGYQDLDDGKIIRGVITHAAVALGRGPPPGRRTSAGWSAEGGHRAGELARSRPRPSPGSTKLSHELGRPRVIGVDVPADDHDRDAPGAGQLERDRGRLRAAARHPGVVDDQHVGPGHDAVDAEPAGVDAAPVSRPRGRDRQAHQRNVNAGPDEARQRMTARAAPAARHDRRDPRGRRHPGRGPHRLPVLPEVAGQHLPQPRRRIPPRPRRPTCTATGRSASGPPRTA